MRDQRSLGEFLTGFILLVGLIILALSWPGCAMRHELTEQGHPDYHGCPPVDAAYLEGCPELDSLRECPYLDRPCEYYHATSFLQALPELTCTQRLDLREDYCPDQATPLWPPTPGHIPCCTAEENLP